MPRRLLIVTWLFGALLAALLSATPARAAAQCNDYQDDKIVDVCQALESGREALVKDGCAAALDHFIQAVGAASPLAADRDLEGPLFRAALYGVYYCEAELKHYTHAARIAIELEPYRGGEQKNQELQSLRIPLTREQIGAKIKLGLGVVSVLVKQDRILPNKIALSMLGRKEDSEDFLPLQFGAGESSVSSKGLILDPFHQGMDVERFSTNLGSPEPTTSSTEFVLQVNPGEYQLISTLVGHRTLRQERRIKSGQSEDPLVIDYPAAKAALRLSFKPTDARLSIDEERGTERRSVPGVPPKSSPQPIELRPGTYQIAVSRFGYEPFQQRLQLFGAQEHTIANIQLQLRWWRRPKIVGPIGAAGLLLLAGVITGGYFGALNAEPRGGNTGVVFRPE